MLRISITLIGSQHLYKKKCPQPKLRNIFSCLISRNGLKVEWFLWVEQVTCWTLQRSNDRHKNDSDIFFQSLTFDHDIPTLHHTVLGAKIGCVDFDRDFNIQVSISQDTRLINNLKRPIHLHTNKRDSLHRNNVRIGCCVFQKFSQTGSLFIDLCIACGSNINSYIDTYFKIKLEPLWCYSN